MNNRVFWYLVMLASIVSCTKEFDNEKVYVNKLPVGPFVLKYSYEHSYGNNYPPDTFSHTYALHAYRIQGQPYYALDYLVDGELFRQDIIESYEGLDSWSQNLYGKRYYSAWTSDFLDIYYLYGYNEETNTWGYSFDHLWNYEFPVPGTLSSTRNVFIRE